MRRFSQTGIQDFLTLTLTEHSGLLYVGAREALFAFSVEALELQGVVRGGAVGGTQRGEGKDSGGVAGCRLSIPQPSGVRISNCFLLLVSASWGGLRLFSEWGPGRFLSVGVVWGFSQNWDQVSPLV